MKQILGLSCIVLLLINWSVGSTIKTHNCLSGTIGICILDHVFYNESDSVTHIFPKNQTHIRIGSDMWSKGIDSVITEFGDNLYRALGEPLSLEIVNAGMETLRIPRELVVGNFADNNLRSFSVEPGSADPKLTYLDLGRSTISNLTNISSLVNLETLFLFNNALKTLETSVFQNLTKLRFLNLNYNSIERIVGDHLPQSLTYLGLYYNDLRTLDYSTLRLASLEVLNIERNQLQSISAAKLIAAMPKLRLVRIGRNHIDQNTLLATIEDLRRHNISVRDEGDVVACYYDEDLIEGVCMDRQMLSSGWIKATLLSLATVLVAIVFVLLAWWVFRAMNK